MPTSTPITTPEPQCPLYTTANHSLGNDIATLTGIFDGHYDGYNVDKLLLHITRNLARLRNLLLARKH